MISVTDFWALYNESSKVYRVEGGQNELGKQNVSLG